MIADGLLSSNRSSRLGVQYVIWVLAGFVMVSLAGVSTAALSDDPSTIEISYLNKVYRDLDSDLEPIRQGPIVIHVSSPEHRLEVLGNRLRFSANEDGTVGAAIEVDFEGSGQLIADVEGFGRFVDQVEAPRQTVRAAGTVRLSPTDGGYLMTIVTVEPSTEVQIKSQLAGQIVGVCEAAALIPLISLPCDGVAAALETVRIPLPAAGSQVLVPSDEMSSELKAYFNHYAIP